MKLRTALRKPALQPWLIIIPGAILRLWGLTWSPLWYDEAFTRLLAGAGLPFDQMLLATAGDVHPPLYYVLVWLSGMGSNALTLRLFSAAWSIAALGAFWWLTREMHLARPARLIALAIMAFHPQNIYYAQEGRMYAMLELLLIMQFIMLVREDWIGLGVFTLAGLYTHNYALIYTAMIGVVGILRQLAKPREIYRAGIDGELAGVGISKLAISLGVPGVLWLPWTGVLFRQMKMVANGYWIEPLSTGSVLADILHILVGFNLPPQFLPGSMFAVTAGLSLLLLYGLKGKQLSLLVLGFGPLASAIGLSLIWTPMLLYRGLIGTIPPLAMLAGAALGGAGRRGRLIGLALALPLAVATVWQIGANYTGNVKGVPVFTLPDTTWPVVHLDDTTLVTVGQPARDYLLDAGCPGEGGALTHLTRSSIGFRTIRLEDLPERFLFAGLVGPLTTGCHEEVFRAITARLQPVYQVNKELVSWGVWYADSKR